MATELAVLSGKGGTGKTSLVGSLAALARKKVLVDCDVDAADLHLILNPEIGQAHNFTGVAIAKINQEQCMVCGICVDYCRFGAIKYIRDPDTKLDEKFMVDEYSCEGCGVCTHFCPESAIDFNEVVSGRWFISETRYGPLVHARLGIAQANSGKLVSVLRKEAARIAEEINADLIIIDGPPGIGCPVIASMTGVGYILIVTEPSMSAFHDMERILQLIRHFDIKAGICINKYDINQEITDQIENFVQKTETTILGRIPFDEGMTKAQIKGIPYIEYSGDGVSNSIKQLWNNLEKEMYANGRTKQPSHKNLIQL